MQIYSIRASERGQRLDKYLRRCLPKAPSSFIYKTLRKKNILLNGKKASGSEIVNTGDEVRIYLSDDTFEKFGGLVHGTFSKEEPVYSAGGSLFVHSAQDRKLKAETSKEEKEKAEVKDGAYVRLQDLQKEAKKTEERAKDNETGRLLDYRQAYRNLSRKYPFIRLIYEDQDIAAVYKPVGVLSQKGPAGEYSINEWFVGLLLERGEASRETLRMHMPSVQNRLDRNTEGLVLLSKTLPGSHLLSGLQREHLLTKIYIMVVAGHVEEGGLIEGWMAKDETVNMSKLYYKQMPGTVYSRTEYRPIAWAKDGSLTGIEAKLWTGRSHQLRVHMAAIGHPILGDPKYGEQALNQRFRAIGVTSQLLICQCVQFPEMEGEFSYLSGKRIEIPLPEIYRSAMGL